MAKLYYSMKALFIFLRRVSMLKRCYVYAGVTTGKRRSLIDPLVSRWSRSFRDLPNYESGCVDSLRKIVCAGDRVTIVGAGCGVTAITAAQLVCSMGSVTVFEGSGDGVKDTINTLNRNPGLCIDLRYAVVGRNVGVYGREVSPLSLHPGDIPECDVLELDCEGAEAEIVAGLKILPQWIIVETHGFLGSSTESIEQLLKERGYEIVERCVAERDIAKDCIRLDIMVILARLRTHGSFKSKAGKVSKLLKIGRHD